MQTRRINVCVQCTQKRGWQNTSLYPKNHKIVFLDEKRKLYKSLNCIVSSCNLHDKEDQRKCTKLIQTSFSFSFSFSSSELDFMTTKDQNEFTKLKTYFENETDNCTDADCYMKALDTYLKELDILISLKK